MPSWESIGQKRNVLEWHRVSEPQRLRFDPSHHLTSPWPSIYNFLINRSNSGRQQTQRAPTTWEMLSAAVFHSGCVPGASGLGWENHRPGRLLQCPALVHSVACKQGSWLQSQALHFPQDMPGQPQRNPALGAPGQRVAMGSTSVWREEVTQSRGGMHRQRTQVRATAPDITITWS